MTERTAVEWVQEGLAFHQQGDLESAQECYQRALGQDSTLPDALHFLGMAKFQGGEPYAAEDLVRQSLEMRSGSATYHYNLGQLLEGQGRLDEALWAYELALTLDPGNAAALNERGRLLRQERRVVEAETAFREAINMDPEAPEARTNLGLLLWEQGDLPGALELFHEACKKSPQLLPAQVHRLGLLVQMGRVEEALETADKAEAAGIRHPLLEVERAGAEEAIGRLEAAAERLEKVLSEHPDDLQALFYLAPLAGRLGRPFPRDRAEALLQSPDPGQEARSLCAFALGAYADSQKEHDAAFMYWLEANQAEGHQAVAQSLERRYEYWSSLRQAFSSQVIEDLASWGYPEAAPIFVVGMPRSGTTLVEQILASHPRVTGVGETGLVHEVLRDHLRDSDLQVSEKGEPSLTPERSAELGRIYWEKLRELAPGAERVVEKTPGNFQNLGLIWALFPRARVILCQREPLDSGVSMFSLRFTRSIEFAFDLETLGRFLQSVRPHMEHWQAVLPADFLLPIDYEALVMDPEPQVERLLEHCGLEWEPACLRFFETKRTVRTASQAQVRQPLYRSAVQRWPRYEKHLLPLARAAGMEARLPEEARREFRSFSRLGERQLKRGQVQEAVGSFRRALLWEPVRRNHLHDRLGRSLEAAERYREAEACFRTTLEAASFRADSGEREDLVLARVRCLRKAGDLREARNVLEAASVSPGPARWTEEGWLRLGEGALAEAEPFFDAALAEAETDEARAGWAETLERAGRRAELQEALQALAARSPERELPALRLGRLFAEKGNLEEAEEWARRALDRTPHSHRGHTLWAFLQFLRDRPDAAEQSLQRALTRCPDHFPAHRLLAKVHLSQLQVGEAATSAREALGLREDPEARILYGRARFLEGHEEEGLETLRAVRCAHPERPEAWGEEITALAELNRREEAWALLEEARARFPEEEGLRFRELRMLRQEGAEAEALEGLRSLSGSMRENPTYQAELGHLYDRMGDPDNAMACFRQANERFSRQAVARRYPKEVALSRVVRLKATVTEEWAQAWRAPSQASGWEHPPVFLLGFPRSGTTLLDQVLSSHSQVEVLSERQVFEEVANELRRRYGGDLKGLAEMDEVGIAEMQEYYRQVREGYRQDIDALLVVEKMPLRTVEAGLVYRLFPDARFLFARRHPADCVLSGFMQMFAPNVAMANFHTLEDAARYYRAVMELWGQYRRALPGMRVHEIRYEELVVDFDAVVNGLLEFLGLPWEDEVREFGETALRRGRITTPSRTQVTQPLYGHARYRWRRYRAHFGQAWEEIRPFMEAAGYPAE